MHNTPEGIRAFQLMQWRGIMRLEKVGLKSRQGALRPKIAKYLGLKPRDPHDRFIEAIEAQLREIY